MHTANVRLLITALENSADEHFDMAAIYTLGDRAAGPRGITMPKREGCGTAACIAGWCGWLATTDAKWRPSSIKVNLQRHLAGEADEWRLLQAVAWLDIGRVAARELFTPPGWRRDHQAHCYPRLRAIAVLKDMLKTYEDTGLERVRWEAFPYEDSAPESVRAATPPTPAMDAPPAPTKPLPVELTRLTQEA